MRNSPFRHSRGGFRIPILSTRFVRPKDQGPSGGSSRFKAGGITSKYGMEKPRNCALGGGGSQLDFKVLSRLFRNVPILNLLEMSPFVDVEQNVAVAQYEQGWGARGEGAGGTPKVETPN